jgi:hypothetical protein
LDDANEASHVASYDDDVKATPTFAQPLRTFLSARNVTVPAGVTPFAVTVAWRVTVSLVDGYGGLAARVVVVAGGPGYTTVAVTAVAV